jgi:hypothetical protein
MSYLLVYLGKGVALVEQVQELGDDLRTENKNIRIQRALTRTIGQFAKSRRWEEGGTWQHRRASSWGSWKTRASCSTAPFSMPRNCEYYSAAPTSKQAVSKPIDRRCQQTRRRSRADRARSRARRAQICARAPAAHTSTRRGEERGAERRARTHLPRRGRRPSSRRAAAPWPRVAVGATRGVGAGAGQSKSRGGCVGLWRWVPSLDSE